MQTASTPWQAWISSHVASRPTASMTMCSELRAGVFGRSDSEVALYLLELQDAPALLTPAVPRRPRLEEVGRGFTVQETSSNFSAQALVLVERDQVAAHLAHHQRRPQQPFPRWHREAMAALRALGGRRTPPAQTRSDRAPASLPEPATFDPAVWWSDRFGDRDLQERERQHSRHPADNGARDLPETRRRAKTSRLDRSDELSHSARDDAGVHQNVEIG